MPDTQQHIEEQTSHLLNDTPTTITLAGTTYHIAPPTFAQLARISGEIARLNIGTIDPTHLAQDVLREARHSYRLARILATAIEATERKTIYKRIRDKLRRTSLTDRIFASVTPSEATEAFAIILQTLQLGDFFAFTTFLKSANITRATKVEPEATAPGASSQAS